MSFTLAVTLFSFNSPEVPGPFACRTSIANAEDATMVTALSLPQHHFYVSLTAGKDGAYHFEVAASPDARSTLSPVTVKRSTSLHNAV